MPNTVRLLSVPHVLSFGTSADRHTLHVLGNVEASLISIGAWPWGDTATWNWSPEELGPVKEAWNHCIKNGVNYIDTGKSLPSLSQVPSEFLDM